MKTDRIAVGLVAAACLVGLQACSGTHEVSDAQLTRLLRTEQSAASNPSAPLDVGAVHCLRAWSGDPGLTQGLPPSVVGEAGKKGCRTQIDGWLADADRNPDRLSFEDVTAPAAAGRAAALMSAHHEVDELPAAQAQPPAALVQEAPLPDPKTPANMNEVAELNAAIDELDTLCQDAEAKSGTNPRASRYAQYCRKRVAQLRSRSASVSATGDARQVEMVTRNVQNLLTVGRRIAARQNQGQARQ